VSDIISMERDGPVFRINIDMPLEQHKAVQISTLIEADAGNASVEVGPKRRLRRLIAQGVVTPMTTREIMKVLAA